MLRLSALQIPFTFVDIAQHHYLVPLIVLSWVLGSGMAWLEHHFWDHDRHTILLYLWFTFIGLTQALFVAALAVLVPLLRHQDSYLRGTAKKLFILAFFYTTCFSSFGVMNVLRHYICNDHVMDHVVWLRELFCDYGNFLTVIFIFPTINSIANAVVISRAALVQEELRSWGWVCCGIPRYVRGFRIWSNISRSAEL